MVAEAPYSNRLELPADTVHSQTVPGSILVVGDSRCVDGSPGPSNYAAGVQRMWRIPWAGRVTCPIGGLGNHSGNCEQVTTGSVDQRMRQPGQSFFNAFAGLRWFSADGYNYNPARAYVPLDACDVNGVGYRCIANSTGNQPPHASWVALPTSNWCAMNWLDVKFSGNVAGNGFGQPFVVAVSLADLANYFGGNPFLNIAMSARMLFNGNADGLASGSFVGARGTANTAGPAANQTVACDMSTPTGARFVDALCGSHATDAPYARFIFGAGDETGKTVQIGHFVFWNPAATKGAVLSTYGTSNYTNADILSAWGGAGGVGGITTDAASQTTFESACPFGANGYIGVVHQLNNLTGAEGTEFGTNGYAVYKAGRAAVIDRFDAMCLAKFGKRCDFHLLEVNPPGETEWTNSGFVNGNLRALAHHELSQERSNVACTRGGGFRICGTMGTATAHRPMDCTDGLHPTGHASTPVGHGVSVWAGGTYSDIANAKRTSERGFRADTGRIGIGF